MKKQILITSAMLLMSFILTGCGLLETIVEVTIENDGSEAGTSSESEPTLVSSTTVPLTNEGDYSSLESWFNGKLEYYEEIAKTTSEEGSMNLIIHVEDNVLIYTYQHKKPLETGVEAEAERLDALFTEYADIYQQDADMIAWEAGLTDVIKRHEFIAYDGTFIYSKDFVASGESPFQMTIEYYQ